jgi:pyroglutamyl-peptidase
MYNLLHHIQTVHPELKGGFIHVPYSLEQVKNKCLPPFAMETEEIARGVEICVRALISDLRD